MNTFVQLLKEHIQPGDLNHTTGQKEEKKSRPCIIQPKEPRDLPAGRTYTGSHSVDQTSFSKIKSS